MVLSEYPDNDSADTFISQVNGITGIGKFFAKSDKSFNGLSKGECRNIYNTSVLNSSKISKSNKDEIRDILMKLGCKGLTDPSDNN